MYFDNELRFTNMDSRLATNKDLIKVRQWFGVVLISRAILFYCF